MHNNLRRCSTVYIWKGEALAKLDLLEPSNNKSMLFVDNQEVKQTPVKSFRSRREFGSHAISSRSHVGPCPQHPVPAPPQPQPHIPGASKIDVEANIGVARCTLRPNSRTRAARHAILLGSLCESGEDCSPKQTISLYRVLEGGKGSLLVSY